MNGNDLAGFLLARIVEDEDTARTAAGKQGDQWFDEQGIVSSGISPAEDVPGHYLHLYAPEGRWNLWDCEGARSLGVHEVTSAHLARWDPARVLAECEAKRRIVALVTDKGDWFDYDILRLLALPHADHPDYRVEWRTR